MTDFRPGAGASGRESASMAAMMRAASSRAAIALAGSMVGLLSGCGGDRAAVTPLDVPATVAIGILPDPLSDAPTLPVPPAPPTTQQQAGTTTTIPRPSQGKLGEVVLGDRLLMIGDSLLASAAPRHNELLCDALTLFGWEAEIDAEPGHDLDFADAVLDARLDPDGEAPWDVVALAFGSEVDTSGTAGTDSLDAFEQWLDDTIDRVAPRPTVLYTLSETDAEPGRVELNDIIRDRPRFHPNVIVVDWAELGGDAGEVLDESGQALTTDGRKRFSLQTASALGEAPDDPDGECLPSDYRKG
jgi:hypothetical protein